MTDTENTTVICDSCGTPWPPDTMRTCDCCGGGCCEDCMRRCDRCDDVLCPDCIEACERCGGECCDNCQRICERCLTHLCADCVEVCDRCGDIYCPDCVEWDDIEGHCVCENCWNTEPDYRDPYEGVPHAEHAYTHGLEIEIDGHHDAEPLRDSRLIAGWKPDRSLCEGGMEYQTQPLPWDAETMDELETLIAGIEPGGCGECAGGHIHIRRTERQTPARWYHALTGIDHAQTLALNMRHDTDDDRWCALRHDAYHGKCTAVNDDHPETIELRTFGAWNSYSAHQLKPALTWVHAMWRFFQHHPLHSLKETDIRRMAYVQARQAIGLPHAIQHLVDAANGRENH
ncbi:hypothetical protein [Bifidobacterium callimiconis]|uniref:Amidoligase enzyme n=1 Tax=Bifidobacterium callimiconis TaxID=2306973 RepID=A0A430FBM8_9BIFI|nr:hypothetical protein [Bifidobacterium callimiconis]RSX50255.1 hypothetical protein D2E23_1803 [Bifidobacterium callimiconis]